MKSLVMTLSGKSGETVSWQTKEFPHKKSIKKWSERAADILALHVVETESRIPLTTIHTISKRVKRKKISGGDDDGKKKMRRTKRGGDTRVRKCGTRLWTSEWLI